MGLSASQGRLLLLTERKNDLEFRAQQISQQRLILSQQLDSISREYEDATSNRQMMISVRNTDDGQTYTKNLTYGLLISGTLAEGNLGGKTGLQTSQYTKTGFETTSSFRLVNADGAIVVGSESEIPTEIKTEETKTKTFAKTEDKKQTGGEYNDIADLYADDGIKIESEEYFQYKNEDANSEYKEFQNALKITYKDKSGTTHKVFYNPETGKLIEAEKEKSVTKALKDESYTTPTKDGDNVVIKHMSYTKKSISDGTLEPNEDGVYTVGDNRYIVDPLLVKDGSTSAGPNYLQDCLRNGKYLIQRGTVDVDEHEFLWKDISWDAVGAISDRYYTEDDDTAKAKYTRLQTEIQNQDKKLELELNNIETQRSAVTTEIESVQKVLDDNIQSSFKTFNA